MRKVALTLALGLLGLSSTAHAHFVLMSPAPANPADASGGKGPPPCGPDGTAAKTPTPVQGGHTLHLDLKETTFHPGWYRIAISMSSRQFPADPAVYDAKGNVLDPTKPGINSASADMQAPAKFPILWVDAWDHTTPAKADFTMDLPIPNFDCPKCTLQIEEFMNQHPSNVGIGGYFYHHCADISITADPALPAYVTGGSTDGGTTDAANPKDAAGDATTGAAGSSGTGAAGTGAAGTTATGAAGTTATGAAGTTVSTGAAGTTASTGAAGTTASTTGAAGTTSRGSSSSGGCTIAGSEPSSAPLFAMALGLVALLRRRRK
jgi:MYXO-CTERM domain-containing protein